MADGVGWLRMPLPFALDHINLWLLDDVDDAGAALTAVDTGFASDETRACWKSALAGRRLRRSIATHGHPDHLGLAAWLEAEFKAPLWMTQGDFTIANLIVAQIGSYGLPAMVDFFRRHGLDDIRLDALKQRGNAFKRGVPSIPLTYRRLLDGQRVAIGAHQWRVIVGYGHTAEHASLYCAELGVLIAGDMLLPRISTNVAVHAVNPDDDPLRLFLEATDAFRALPGDTLVLPSHGRPFRGLHTRVDQLHAHHAERCALLIDACRESKHAAELIPVLFDRDIADPHQVMFAMGEAIAHLNHMHHAGRLARTENDGLIHFVTN